MAEHGFTGLQKVLHEQDEARARAAKKGASRSRTTSEVDEGSMPEHKPLAGEELAVKGMSNKLAEMEMARRARGDV